MYINIIREIHTIPLNSTQQFPLPSPCRLWPVLNQSPTMSLDPQSINLSQLFLGKRQFEMTRN